MRVSAAIGSYSLAIRPGFVALGLDAEAMEARSVPREPAIHGFFDGTKRAHSIRRRERGPGLADLSQNAVDRRGAMRPAPVSLDGPGRAIRFLARQPVVRKRSSLLVGDGQHTAGPVAPAHPARHPCSNASSPVEDEHHVRISDADNLIGPYALRCVLQITAESHSKSFLPDRLPDE